MNQTTATVRHYKLAPTPRNSGLQGPTKKRTLADRALAYFMPPRPVVQRNDSDLVILAIESWFLYSIISLGEYMLVIESYTEDKYGVVQRDLRTIFTDFISLARSIEKYIRVKQVSLFLFQL